MTLKMLARRKRQREEYSVTICCRSEEDERRFEFKGVEKRFIQPDEFSTHKTINFTTCDFKLFERLIKYCDNNRFEYRLAAPYFCVRTSIEKAYKIYIWTTDGRAVRILEEEKILTPFVSTLETMDGGQGNDTYHATVCTTRKEIADYIEYKAHLVPGLSVDVTSIDIFTPYVEPPSP